MFFATYNTLNINDIQSDFFDPKKPRFQSNESGEI